MSLLALGCAAVVACAAPAEEGCPPIAPSRMPDDSELRPAVGQSVSGSARVLIWRSGDSVVVQRIFVAGADGEQACPDGKLASPTDECLVPAAVFVRGRPALFTPTTGEDQWFIAWASGECRYEVAFGPLERDAALVYASGY